MKIFSIIFLCLATIGNANDSFEGIYEKAKEIVIENDGSQLSDEKLLYEFYSKEIKQFDLATLQQNPEFVFRKSLAWFEMLQGEDNINKVKTDLHFLEDDFAFVMQYAEPGSLLFSAAKLRKDFIHYVLNANPKHIWDFPSVVYSYFDFLLQPWATNPHAKGKKLRKEVISNIGKSQKMRQSFEQFLILFQDEPEIVLGKIPVESVEILGIEDDLISYRIIYSLSEECNVTLESQI